MTASSCGVAQHTVCVCVGAWRTCVVVAALQRLVYLLCSGGDVAGSVVSEPSMCVRACVRASVASGSRPNNDPPGGWGRGVVSRLGRAAPR
eukprot:5428672-Alexandrium_andersonii.AAC.1